MSAEVRAYSFSSHVEYTGFLGETAVFAEADGSVHLIGGTESSVLTHEGGLLCACLSQAGTEIVSGGEDGRVVSTDALGTVRELATQPGKWIDIIAVGPRGAFAIASGRNVHVVLGDGSTREFSYERSIEALAFAPKGMRLAAAHYNGVSLDWITTTGTRMFLEWAGAHIGVSFSPDGRFIVTAMQENALHGWKLDDRKSNDDRHMRMTGYPAKVKSLSWSAKGKWLASSGAQAAIVWPFSGKDGPMGKAPKELGTRGDSLVTQVACHPQAPMVAVGYADGMILAIRIEDGNEAVLRKSGNSAISTMNWDKKGKRLAFGSEAGEAGIVSLT